MPSPGRRGRDGSVAGTGIVLQVAPVGGGVGEEACRNAVPLRDCLFLMQHVSCSLADWTVAGQTDDGQRRRGLKSGTLRAFRVSKTGRVTWQLGWMEMWRKQGLGTRRSSVDI